MRRFALILFTLMFSLLPGRVLAAAEVSKTYCASSFDYDSLAAMKIDIVALAKVMAVNELFGELITATATVENFTLTSEQIQSFSAGYVRVGDIVYFNGEDLGEICVTVTAYVTDEDMAKFEPELIAKRYCYTEPSLSVSALRERTQQEALTQALIAYDPNLVDLPRSRLLRLAQKLSYPESDFVPGTETYCVAVEGYVLPIEIMSIRAAIVNGETPPPTLTATHTPAPEPTATPTPIPTVRPTVTPTSTRRPVQVAPTPTPTIVQSAGAYRAPSITSPTNGQRFGPDQSAVLAWSSSGPLAAGDYFVVKVQHAGGFDYQIVAQSPLVVPDFLRKSQWQNGFPWQVAICRNGALGGYGRLTCDLVSPWSEERVFYWERESSSPGGGSDGGGNTGPISPLPTAVGGSDR